MAQMRGSSVETAPTPDFSDRELAVFAAIAREKGLSSVTSLADALKASENSRNSRQRSIARDIAMFENGRSTRTESYYVVGQHSWSPHASEQPWGNWPLLSNDNMSHRDPAPFQTYYPSSTEHLNRALQVGSNEPVSGIEQFTGLTNPSSVSSVES